MRDTSNEVVLITYRRCENMVTTGNTISSNNTSMIHAVTTGLSFTGQSQIKTTDLVVRTTTNSSITLLFVT